MLELVELTNGILELLIRTSLLHSIMISLINKHPNNTKKYTSNIRQLIVM